MEISIQNKQQELDVIQQGVITTTSKVKVLSLAKDIENLKEVDDMDTEAIHQEATTFYNRLFTSEATGMNIDYG
ncbi:hypothetical protein LIER_37651 [Lithospermum erythrorhizon]|uniref:Uncharacterized protein n=1 Tax=Lithospermum erythrorhizon TaxID=34254 RepID=A0AAV3PSJ1_LITER